MSEYYNPYKLFVGAFVPNWLLERTEISAGAKLCFAKLAQYAGKDGKAFPFQKTLGVQLGVCVRQVKRYINELVKYRLIEVKNQAMDRPNLYYFCAHKWMSCPHGGDGYVPSEGTDMSPPIHIEENHIRESIYISDDRSSSSADADHSLCDKKLPQKKEINEIFEYWKAVMEHPTAKLDKKRTGLIKKAFLLGYTGSDLKNAINGCKLSAWHRGKNDQGKVYDSIGLIFRDSDHLERFINLFKRGKKKEWWEDVEWEHPDN